MSLSHIKNRREPTIFGNDLNVLTGDLTINGDVVVQGTINGTSSGNQSTNNVWTGTNQFQKRPTCEIISNNDDTGVNKKNVDDTLLLNSVINRNVTWANTYSFTKDIFVNENINTVGSTDIVTGKYLNSQMNSKYNSYLLSPNIWTGTNTFSNFIPTRNTNEISGVSAVTKLYVDTSTRNLTIGNATSISSQSPLNNYNFGTQYLAHQLQLVGGGGGSASSNNNSFSTSGGSSSLASIILLAYSPLAVSLAIPSNLNRFSIEIGSGGLGQTVDQIPTDGLPSKLSSTSSLAYPLSSDILQVNGGKSANSGTSIYTNINSLMVSPYSKTNGIQGVVSGTETYQPCGFDRFGTGAKGGKSSNGNNGLAGGYTITSYEI